MKILVTGGTGKMARHIKSTQDLEFLLPSKRELNVGDYNSVQKYLKENKDIEGIVLNAVQYLPNIGPGGNINTDNFTLEEYTKVKEASIEGLKVNLLPSLQFIYTLKDQLKFIILLSTGLDPILENNYVLYRNSKASIQDLLIRVANLDKHKELKIISLHPGHMHDEYTFTQSAKQVVKFIENLDKMESCQTYGIFDKTKMQTTKIDGYTQLEIIDL